MARQWMQSIATGPTRAAIMPGMMAALALACASCAPASSAPPGEPVDAPCTVTDGDTIRCGDERIRLLGIDAPELPGHCRKGRTCVEGDGFASKDALKAAIEGKAITLQRVKLDRYGRTLAVVYAGDVNLSCAMVESGQAVYVRKWDDRRLVARDCNSLEQ